MTTCELRKDIKEFRSKYTDLEKRMLERIDDTETKYLSIVEIDNLMEKYLNSEQMVKLNVGGKIFVTKLNILLSFKSSFFYIYFSRLFKENKSIPDEIFIDRNYTYFDYVLDYMKTGKSSFYAVFKDKTDQKQLAEEISFYGLNAFSNSKSIDVEWSLVKSKPNVTIIDDINKRHLRIKSTTCYTHFVIDKEFKGDENFLIEFESDVKESNDYLNFGIFNEKYNTESNCNCCNPSNAYYIKCDGCLHMSGKIITTQHQFKRKKVIIGMEVMLSDMKMRFYEDSIDNCTDYYDIIGDVFQVYASTCNTANGDIMITKCHYI